MSQGKRGGWVRKFFAGLGVVVCVSVLGCNDLDKPKQVTGTKQPGTGLPGLPSLPGQRGSGVPAPGQSGATGGVQPMGSFGAAASRAPASGSSPTGNSSFGTGANGNQLIPPVTPNTNYPSVGNGPVSPATGLGAASSNGVGTSALQPALADPGLYPPASPDSRGGPVTPPVPPVAPSYPHN
jgi:hypothetical protein